MSLCCSAALASQLRRSTSLPKYPSDVALDISDSNNVPKLNSDSSHFTKWKSAVIIYAQMHGASMYLQATFWSRQNQPRTASSSRRNRSTYQPSLTIMADRRAFDDNVRSNNKTIVEEHKCAHVELRLWQRLDAYLDMAFLQSLPTDLWQAIDNHNTAAQKWQDILAGFEEGGLTRTPTLRTRALSVTTFG
jgi:hypothetical protein